MGLREKRSMYSYLAEITDHLAWLKATTTEEALKRTGRAVNQILSAGTYTLDGNGQYTVMAGAPGGAIRVRNNAAAVAAATTLTNNQASNTFATTTAGAVGLPTNGEAITGFTVALAGGAAAVTGVITVTNVAGGTISYEVQVPTTGLVFTVNYPQPLPASAAGVAPTVNVPNFVAGAYSIAVYGQVSASSAAAQHAMTVHGAGPQGYAPTGGIGQMVLPAGSSDTMPLDSRVFTVYGTPGDTFTYWVSTKAMVPTP